MMIMVSGNDITALAGSISLSSSIDTLGDQLDFEIAWSDMYYFPKQEISAGDIIQVFDDNQKEVFRGIIISKTSTDKNQSFNCFDFAFYLNKSKVVKQFSKVQADTAIQQLLQECNVPCGSIASMPVIISKIYYDKEVSEVIKDILEEIKGVSGKKYYMEMEMGVLCIREDGEQLLQCLIKLAENIAPIDVMATLSSPSKSESIEEMKNSIVLYSGGKENIINIVEVKDSALISKYGLLQETQSVEEKDIPKAKNIAHNLLNDLGHVKQSASITVLGNFDLRAGRTIEVNETMIGLSGKYRIQSASHDIGIIHTCTLELEAV